MGMTTHWVGVGAVILFVLLYSLVIAEEFTQWKKPGRQKHSISRGGEELPETRSGFWLTIFLFLGIVLFAGLAYTIWGSDL